MMSPHKQPLPTMLWKQLKRESALWLSDIALAIASFMFACACASGFSVSALEEAGSHCAFIGGIFAVSLSVFGLYHVETRYFGFRDACRLAAAVSISIAVYALSLLVNPLSASGIGALPVFWMTSLVFLGSARALRRLYARSKRKRLRSDEPERRTLIVGAGDAGEMICRELLLKDQSECPIGFLDDDPDKQSIRIHGLPVLGCIGELPHVIEKYNVDDVVIAMPSAAGETIRRAFSLCRPSNVRVRVLPGLPEVINGVARVSQLRSVQIEDLLHRPAAQMDLEGVGKYLTGKRVLVTGAGGSIGSELCRQIMRFAPESLVLLDHSENSVFEIEQELIETHDFKPTPAVVDIKDRKRLQELFLRERPEVVFHAAAHKHVPLMESDPLGAIMNNVQGTQNVAETAARFKVERLIYVSTDKAVKPSSVMGATKRVGELLVQSLTEHCETKLAIVRFGNVLGSRGSLLPILQRQIARGGPIKLTHPEMTRYFMTIPEAAQLILQAGAMGAKAEKFILDMDKPIRIVDLAHDLIRLHGLLPGVDIPINFIGPRPGEKIHEELVASSEDLTRTEHPKIFVSRANWVERDCLNRQIETLLRLTGEGQVNAARSLLMEIAWDGQETPLQVAA